MKQGRRIYDSKAREFEVEAKHAEWLDALEAQLKAYPKLVELMFGMIDCGPGADTIPDDLFEARKAALKFLKEIGEV